MINLDFLHPYPRYGVAAALLGMGDEYNLDDLTDLKTIALLAAQSIDRALNRYTLRTENNPLNEANTVLKYDYLKGIKVDPGQKSGQTAGNGYYLAPHIITNDKSSANTVAEARVIRDLLLKTKEEDLLKSQQKLKRSYAPLTSKINNGKQSMAEPRANLLEAAFTVITTLTEYKPAAQVFGTKGASNTTVIPDLPLIGVNSNPLIDFVRLFADLQYQVGKDFKESSSPFHSTIDPKDRKYRRPPIFRGNYPDAPRDGSLGVVSLVAAIGAWAKMGETFRGDTRAAFATRVLDLLAGAPLYIISYEENRQESFGHHLVKIALEDDLADLIQSAHQAKLLGVEKIDDPKLKLYKFFFDRFLQQFSQPAFRDFLATRAEYPNNLSPLIEQYMATEHKNLSPELIKSARAYGQSLNRAAYRAAKKEKEEDVNNGRTPRDLREYKNRILVQFESTIMSTKSPVALLSQMNTISGRLTGYEIDEDAGLFMEAIAGWLPTKDNTSLAQELITAFMRLNSYVPSEKPDSNKTNSSADESGPLND
ncbi:hypothetical protein GCM10023091_05970 [Ravibacter arvi]|uniref:Uncharacterized protein n=1 Tax=Ravibacter arvi TaxID=2051041 RepID=A0ABP8LNS8_9BACT